MSSGTTPIVPIDPAITPLWESFDLKGLAAEKLIEEIYRTQERVPSGYERLSGMLIFRSVLGLDLYLWLKGTGPSAFTSQPRAQPQPRASTAGLGTYDVFQREANDKFADTRCFLQTLPGVCCNTRSCVAWPMNSSVLPDCDKGVLLRVTNLDEPSIRATRQSSSVKSIQSSKGSTD